MSWTAEEDLLIFWPPGPEPLRNLWVVSERGSGCRSGWELGFGLGLFEVEGVGAKGAECEITVEGGLGTWSGGWFEVWQVG